jgi:hypothetical protein
MRQIAWMGMVVALTGAACGSSGSSSAPSPGSAAISVTATPSTIAGRVCAGCGAQSTDREAVTQLTIQETGGVAATVTAIGVALRENGTNAPIGGGGEFDSAAIVSFAGTSRLGAGGSLVIRDIGVHYPSQQAGKAGTLTFSVRIRDDSGNTVSRDLAVAVSVT